MAVASVAALVVGCGGSAVAMRPLPVPEDGAAREEAIRQGGERLYGALAAGRPESLLADDVELRSLVDPETASRYAVLRLGTGVRLDVAPEQLAPFARARFGGVCLQGARLEPKGSRLGLLSDGWVFDRALVMGIEPGGRRLGAWVEGTFVYTPGGFVALSLSRVEVPRWEHSDLELAPCDMEVGLRGTRYVVGVTP